MNIETLQNLDETTLVIFLIILTLWVIPWKGYALWRSAKNSHKGWFIALLVINTLAILDIIYVFFVDKKGKNNDKNN